MNEAYLYILNDNVNSFKKVYAVLMKELEHLPIQAEQCCMIAHNNGKCHVKTGEYIEMLKLQETLAEYEIKSEIYNERQ